MKRVSSLFMLLWALIFIVTNTGTCATGQIPIVMAVEFCDHAACAHIARNKGWFQAAGINVIAFDNYITGMALAAALARGEINVAYVCLIPAINAYANAKVPLKVVAGTHRYGYGLIVNPAKIKTVNDLERPGIRIGCPREGSPLDALLHKAITRYHLNEGDMLKKIRRMAPVKVFLAMKMGRLDAGFCQEQFPTMGEASGFRTLLNAQDLWPRMQGSVLVVKQELIDEHPEMVRRIVEVTKRAIRYIRSHPGETAQIEAKALAVTGRSVFPTRVGNIASRFTITPQIILKSLTTKMALTAAIDPGQIQETIDYMAQLGYIRRFNAKQILDLRFLHDGKE